MDSRKIDDANPNQQDRPGDDKAVPGLAYNGEYKLGAITIGQPDGLNITLRHENVGTEKKVALVVLEGFLEDRFFTDKTDADTSEDDDK